MTSLLDKLRAAANRGAFLETKPFTLLLERCITVLEHEQALVRPSDSTALSGGLIRLDKNIPTVVLPDLHGRFDFFLSVMESPLFGQESLAQAVQNRQAQILCLGDGFHSELRGKERWISALDEYINGYKNHASMDQEMTESFVLMEMVMECKCALKEGFHFLKGNHENILNEEGNGNHSFRKFAYEGAMVRDYVSRFCGNDFLQLYAIFEKRLPLFAIGSTFIASHAEPSRFFNQEELIDGRNRNEVLLGLTWTANDEAEEGSVERMLREYSESAETTVYISGHRPVKGTYALRANGKLVQIHNPSLRVGAIVSPARPFNPDVDIYQW